MPVLLGLQHVQLDGVRMIQMLGRGVHELVSQLCGSLIVFLAHCILQHDLQVS